MKYIAFCDTEDYLYENRAFELSASNVVRYMAETFGAVEDVEIIAPMKTRNTKSFCRGRSIFLNDQVKLTVPCSKGTKTRIGSIIQAIWMRIWLIQYMIFHTHKKEQIVVYHSYDLIKSIKFLRWLKRYRIIMECRELYADIRLYPKNKRNYEIGFLQSMDKYIFPSKTLNRLINVENKPYVIAPSIYKTEKKTSDKWEDGKIHIIYAGTFHPRKGGAMVSIQMAEYLPDIYHVHILGRGSDDYINRMNAEIERVNGTNGACVTYDGVRFGEEFKEFLQKCHIGLSTQNIEEKFNNTSFPSKILTYLSNGLEVVSGRIEPVVESPVGKYLYYYERQDPQNIAEVVKQIDINNITDKTKILNDLDSRLKQDIKSLLMC